MTITSIPAGARITADGKSYGETPANIEWWGELAKPGREVTFIAAKDGHEKVTLVRSIKSEKLTLDATLPRSRAPPASRGRARPPKGPVVVTGRLQERPLLSAQKRSPRRSEFARQSGSNPGRGASISLRNRGRRPKPLLPFSEAGRYSHGLR